MTQPMYPTDVHSWLLRGLDHLILVTDENLTVVGDPIASWLNIDVTLKFNEPSSGQFTCPGTPSIRDQIVAGNRIVVLRAGQVLIAGPYETSMYERADDGEHSGDGTLTVTFSDDLARVMARQAYPDPAQTPETQTTDSWTFTGNAELALRDLVDRNAGPNALAARQIPNLEMGNLVGVGSSITATAERMEPLGDVMRRIALAGGNLGFRTRQDGTRILFEVYAVEDLSSSVRFSFELGSLKYVGYEVSAPVATAAIVGGQGDGVARFVLERVNTSAQTDWGRLETLVSRAGDTPVAELQADGDEALAENAPTARLAVSAMDTPDMRFGQHYNVGSKVAVSPYPGTQIADTVLTVHLQVFPTAGEVVSSTIGSQAALSDAQWIKRLRDIDRRVGRVERNLVPGVP